MRIGTTDAVRSANILLDPNLAYMALISHPPLTRLSPEIKPEGLLAEKVVCSQDMATWTFVLHEDYFWSDGRPVTAADVKFTLEYLQDKYPAIGWIRGSLDEIVVNSDFELSLRLSQPYARLDFEFLTYKILPRHIWTKIENPMRFTNPGHNVGCGPFVIERIDLNRGVITFIRNPHWKRTRPQIDTIEVHIFKNRDILALALEMGRLDAFYEYAATYPYAYLKKLRTRKDFVFAEKLNLGLFFLGFNLRKSPMDDPEFREALSYAIDYAEIRRIITLGNGEVPGRSFIPPGMPHFKELGRFTYDPARARDLLVRAGYRDIDGNGSREDGSGRDLKLVLLFNPALQSYARLAELLKDYFQAAGIAVSLKAVEGNSWINLKDNYRYDILLSRTTPWGMLMHASWATGYFDSRRTGEGVLHTVDDPAFLKLCDDLLAVREEESRRELAYRVQEYYAQNLPAIPLVWNRIVTPCSTRFSGWTLDPVYGLFHLENFLKVVRKSP